jgi:hypothetical protein
MLERRTGISDFINVEIYRSRYVTCVIAGSSSRALFQEWWNPGRIKDRDFWITKVLLEPGGRHQRVTSIQD